MFCRDFSLGLVVGSTLLFSCVAYSKKDLAGHQGLTPLEGYWRDQRNPTYFLGLQGSQFTISYGGRVREVFRILSREGAIVRVCDSGRDRNIFLKEEGNELIYRDLRREETHRLLRLGEKPPPVSMSFPLPELSAVSGAKVQEVQKELFRRQQEEQAVLRPQNRVPFLSGATPWLRGQSRSGTMAFEPDREIRLADLAAQNGEYIRNLLSEVGWIDVKRFGYAASNAAFLLVQHSWDAPVMLSVLPFLKRDVDEGLMEPDAYALMYDRLQLALGLRQRYGTQIGRSLEGEPFVLPVEDPAQVETLRRQLGLIPLAEYVRVFGAPDVRFSSECQEPAELPRGSGGTLPRSVDRGRS